MRLLPVLLVLSFVVACGKSGGGGSSSSSNPEEQQCEVNGAAVACDSVYDGLGVDILDASLDVQANVTTSAINFTQSKNSESRGRRIGCSLSVKEGDSYSYTVNGNTLYLNTPEGNIAMTRVHGHSSIVGTWKWKGIVDGATLETKIMTVTKGMNRVIFKQNCER